MAVPNRPTAGGVVESAWGQVVHDTAVAQDIQSGIGSITLTNENWHSLVVVFPRPFASPPAVVCTPSGASAVLVAGTGGVSATQATLYLFRKDEQSSTLTCPVHWLAIGPRA